MTTTATKPKTLRLMTHAERVAMYGEPATIKDGKLAPSAVWEAVNLVRVNVPWASAGTLQRLKVHTKVADKFLQLFEAWADADLSRYLLSFDGAHNTRVKRGYEGSLDLANLSTHAFGAAMDINARYNPLGARGALADQPGTVRPLVGVARELGFVWGGTFSRPDGMHFEVGIYS